MIIAQVTTVQQRRDIHWIFRKSHNNNRCPGLDFRFFARNAWKSLKMTIRKIATVTDKSCTFAATWIISGFPFLVNFVDRTWTIWMNPIKMGGNGNIRSWKWFAFKCRTNLGGIAKTVRVYVPAKIGRYFVGRSSFGLGPKSESVWKRFWELLFCFKRR